ncbi:hypothetical protein SAMN02910436_02968, partial [Ruminococcaceae bacterium P7]
MRICLDLFSCVSYMWTFYEQLHRSSKIEKDCDFLSYSTLEKI